MKARKKAVLILVGVTVALITAGVPVVQYGRLLNTVDDDRLKKCYTDSDVTLLMGMMNTSRERATEVLELACTNAAGIKE
jgi:hypothetical protein